MTIAHEIGVRGRRDRFLRETDWTQLSDVPLSPEKRQEYAVYRQALRDITLQEGFPLNVIFPEEPK